jgi:hypothetical protein
VQRQETESFAAGIVYLAVVFAGGYLLRVLTRNLTAGMDRPGESAEQVKKPGCRLVGTVFGRDRNTGSVSLDGRTDSYVKASARFPELEERFAEFFLIGRLPSIGLAFLDGLVLVQPWYGTMSLK